MATPKQLHAGLILFFAITNVVGDTITTSVTTFDAASCAIPSCTVTPASLTSDITIQPTPTTIFVPGHVLPLVFSFDRVTLDAFQPEPTVLRNDGTGTLTLGTTTLTNLPSASATRSYTVDIAPDVTLKAVVSVAVQAEAPLFIDRQHDSNDACELFPELGRRSARKRITGRRLRVVKREPIPIRVSPDMGAGIIEPALAAARKVLTAIRTYFDGVSAADVPDNLGLAKWLPETIPGTGQPTFDRIIQTVRALLRFLDENENEDARFVVTTGEGTKLLRSCTPGVAAVTFPGKTQQLSDTCTVEGWIIFCRTLLAWKMEERILVDEVKPDEKPEGLPFLCSDQDFRKKLDENRFELGVSWGSLAAQVYHEMLHLRTVCAAGGWGMTRNSAGDEVRVSANWNENDPEKNSNPEMYATDPDGDGEYEPDRLLNLTPQQKIINAANWEFMFTEFYIRLQCKWTTDGQPWRDSLTS